MRGAIDVDLSRRECHVLSVLLDELHGSPVRAGSPFAVYERGGTRPLAPFLRRRVMRKHPGDLVTLRFGKVQALAIGSFIMAAASVENVRHRVARMYSRHDGPDWHAFIALLQAGTKLRDAGLSRRGRRAALDAWQVRTEYERLALPPLVFPRLVGSNHRTRTQILSELAARFSCEEQAIERALKRAVLTPAVRALTARFPE